MKVFLDTEFTNFIDTGLISIGLAAESGEVFYAEVPYEHAECSEFVKAAVLPLLDPASYGYSADELRIRLHSWLVMVRPSHGDLEICFDYQGDWDLFYDAMRDLMPSWCRPRRVGRNINELLRYEYHSKNNLPEHHALNDAVCVSGKNGYPGRIKYEFGSTMVTQKT
ncbi:MAG: hypothetical protein C4516_09140 [Oxalobacter sp.]|nr:MAG: hypothetical protein C4516_09140 [Oxalobacter sp.]